MLPLNKMNLMCWLKNFRVFFLFKVHADTSLIHCIHCACLKVNNRTNRPSEKPTHRYNSFIAHARIHELKSAKIQSNVWHFFPKLKLNFFLKNAWLPLIFFSNPINPCQGLLFPCNYKPRKNISVLADTTVKKSDHLGMCITYVQ